MAQKLSAEETSVLQVLAFFFLTTGQADSAERAVKALLAVEPNNEWARQFLIVCADARGDYQKSEQLTAGLTLKTADSKDQRLQSLLLLRARALQKLGRSEEAQALCRQLLDSTGKTGDLA